MKQKNKLKCEFCGEEMEWNKAHICNNHTQKQDSSILPKTLNETASVDFKENERNEEIF